MMSRSETRRYAYQRGLSGDMVGDMVLYEHGTLSDDDTVKLFQGIMDANILESLPPKYHHTMELLVHSGKVKVIKEDK